MKGQAGAVPDGDAGRSGAEGQFPFRLGDDLLAKFTQFTGCWEGKKLDRLRGGCTAQPAGTGRIAWRAGGGGNEGGKLRGA